MKRILISSLLLVVSFIAFAQESKTNLITISPYIYSKSGLGPTSSSLMTSKLIRLVTNHGITNTGFDNRFIITPRVNIINESETNTYPQKTAVQVSFTFYVGDGIDGALYGSCTKEYRGIGDNKDEALRSAINKINVNDPDLTSMLQQSKTRIQEYYSKQAPQILSMAKAALNGGRYEDAIGNLMLIPSINPNYAEAQKLIATGSSKIAERDNQVLITQAKAAWSSNPTPAGAEKAAKYLSKVCGATAQQRSEINELTTDMGNRTRAYIDQQNKYEFQYLMRLLDNEYELLITRENNKAAIEQANIEAATRVTEAYYASRPTTVVNYHIDTWWW